MKFLAQGTIYPDIIESGARKTGGKASTTNNHHNLIPFPDGVDFDLIEPLDHFFKDEVRALGRAGAARSHSASPAIPRTRACDPHHWRSDAREARDSEECRCDRARGVDAYNEQLFERSGERNGEVVRESAGGPEVERSVWQYFAVLPMCAA